MSRRRYIAQACVGVVLYQSSVVFSSLVFDPEETTECETSFIYKSETEHIHFMVIDSNKVTWWDYNERGK